MPLHSYLWRPVTAKAIISLSPPVVQQNILIVLCPHLQLGRIPDALAQNNLLTDLCANREQDLQEYPWSFAGIASFGFPHRVRMFGGVARLMSSDENISGVFVGNVHSFSNFANVQATQP